MTGPVRRRPADAVTALLALAVTALCALAVAPGTVGPVERAVFGFVNGWPDALRRPLWLFQTLGVLGMPLLVAAGALLLGRWRLVAGLALLVPLKLIVERRVLKALVHRERPGTTIPGAHLRDVPSTGLSFPSGHAIIAFGIAVLLLPYLHTRWQAVVVVALAVLNSVARVYLGGHAPLDVVGGAAAGVAVGAVLNLVLGVPGPRSPNRGRRPGRRSQLVALAAVVAVALAGCSSGTGSGGGRAGGSTTTVPAPSTTAPRTSQAAPSVPGTGVPAALRGQDVTALPTTRRVVALTFDAGANAAGLPSILATLAAAHVHATFFLTGRWVVENPSGVAAIRAGGHRIGNHTMTHPHVPSLSDRAITDEVRGAEQRIRVAGVDPRPLFRFPFGDRDARTIGLVNDLGYVAVRWTVDTLGWKGTTGGISAQQVTDRTVAGLTPGAIVLMHLGSHPDDGSTLDADALPGTISRIRTAGYGFVTLDALVAS